MHEKSYSSVLVVVGPHIQGGVKCETCLYGVTEKQTNGWTTQKLSNILRYCRVANVDDCFNLAKLKSQN
jgi:hypothetical protein